jgi:hypothetical protein
VNVERERAPAPHVTFITQRKDATEALQIPIIADPSPFCPPVALDPDGRLYFHNFMKILIVTFTFASGEIRVRIPAYSVRVEAVDDGSNAVKVMTLANKPRPGEAPLECAVFPDVDSFLEQFNDWIRRYRQPADPPLAPAIAAEPEPLDHAPPQPSTIEES